MEENLYPEILSQNPFSDKFDIEEVKSFFEKNPNKQEASLISFSLFTNQIYRNSRDKILEILEDLKLSEEELIKFFFKGINKAFIDSQKKFHKQLPNLSDKASSRGIDIEKLSFTKFDTELGNDIKVKEVYERGGDILNLFLNFINKNIDTLNNYSKKNREIDNLKLKVSFNTLWFHFSSIYSMNSFYEILDKEQGEIELQDKTFRIKTSDYYKKVRMLTNIGEIRNNSYLNEYSLRLNSRTLKKRKTFIDFTEQNGGIKPVLGFDKNSDDSSYISKSLNIVGFTNEKIKSLGATVLEITEVFYLIEKLNSLIVRKKLKLDNDVISVIPYYIDKDILIKKIHECTSLLESIIEKIVNGITEKDNSKPYFWRAPLYLCDEKIFLSFPLLNSPNYNLLLESVINSIDVEEKDRIDWFIKEITDEFQENDSEFFSIVSFKNKEFIKRYVVLELKSLYLFISPYIFNKFPIETEEINFSLNSINTHSELIKKEIISLSEIEGLSSDKLIVPIILSNYKIFSGLKFNDIPILDFGLLKNYLFTGQFMKARTSLSSKKRKGVIYNSFKYYKDEIEFNTNLVSFISSPIPINQRLNKIYLKEQEVFPPDVKPQISIEVVNVLSEEDEVRSEIRYLSNLLNYQFYNENEVKERENELLNEQINYSLTNVFNSLAQGKYELSKYRLSLSEVIQKSKIHGFLHLFTYFANNINGLIHIKFKKDKVFKHVEYKEGEINEILKKILSNTNELSLYNLKIDCSFNKSEEKKIISFCISSLSKLQVKKYDINELENFLMYLSFISFFKKKYQLDYEFHSACENLISSLNFNFRYQQARNLAEEILLISIKENKIYRGWGILFQCLDQQNNIYDSTIYGCLYITSLSTESRLNYSEFVEVFYNILKFTRNNPTSDVLLDETFNFLKTIKLKTYDFQKIHLSYFLSVLKRKGEIRDSLINESITFYNKNEDSILNYGDFATIPWLNYFYNLKRSCEDKIIKDFYINEIIERLENRVSKLAKEQLLNLHFKTENSKESFLEKLKNILTTYSYYDFIYEIQNLEGLALHLLEDSIKNKDIDSLLLTGLVFNDLSLIYNHHYIEPNSKVKFDDARKKEFKYLDYYKEFILNKINIKKGQLLIYLFTCYNKVYSLSINSDKDFKIESLDNWDIHQMNSWLRVKNKFYFDNKNYFDLNEQEEAYKKTINQLLFTDINCDENYSEILLYTSLELSKFPINLIVTGNNFLGASKPISNILLLEWFIDNDIEVNLNINYTKSAWIPIEEGDPDINASYDKLEPILDKNLFNVYTSGNPSEQINSDLNVFLAHGELNQLGFKAIYKADGINTAIVENKMLLGKGKIAILFICNSGFMNEDLFSNSIISLVHEIILLGYESVIAPSWSLNTSIPSFWLDEFLVSFNNGDRIIQSVFKANQKLSEYKESISGSFYVPEGRLAMHLYGNPNLKVS